MKVDEYLNIADGLLYCARCHTPRQGHIHWGDSILTPTVMCRCQTEEYEAREARQKRQDSKIYLDRLLQNDLQDSKLSRYRFVYDHGYNNEMKKAYAYVANWGKMKAQGIGLLLWGNVGTGKSFFAGCIANALLEQGIPVLMTNVSKLLNASSDLRFGQRTDFIRRLNQYDLLIIDDLGVERSSEFALEQLFQIIDERYRRNLPLIVTTNLDLKELAEPLDFRYARIYDRILERCVPLKINNVNIRKMNTADNIRDVRSLLSSESEIESANYPQATRLGAKHIISGENIP